jgi:hypothetical protein
MRSKPQEGGLGWVALMWKVRFWTTEATAGSAANSFASASVASTA